MSMRGGDFLPVERGSRSLEVLLMEVIQYLEITVEWQGSFFFPKSEEQQLPFWLVSCYRVFNLWVHCDIKC